MDQVIKGYPYAKAAVDFAYYEMTALALGVPVYTLLGGRARTHYLRPFSWRELGGDFDLGRAIRHASAARAPVAAG